jgi:hypothetical protein
LGLSLFFLPARLRSFKYRLRQAQPWSLLTPSPKTHVSGRAFVWAKRKKYSGGYLSLFSSLLFSPPLSFPSYLILFLSYSPPNSFVHPSTSGPFDPCSLLFGLRSAERIRELKGQEEGGKKGKRRKGQRRELQCIELLDS